MRAELRLDTARLREAALALGRQAPFAKALTMTRTAVAARDDVSGQLATVFDAPTRFTVNSLKARPATKARPVAEVGFRDFAPKGTPAAKYLQPEVKGGPRRHKGFEQLLIRAGVMRRDEYAVPARGFPLDAAGNLPQGIVTRMLANLRASRDGTANTTARSARRAARRKAATYFVPRRGGLARGVFERKGDQVRAVLIFVRAPTYRPRFQFDRLVERSARRHLPVIFRAVFAEVAAKARRL